MMDKLLQYQIDELTKITSWPLPKTFRLKWLLWRTERKRHKMRKAVAAFEKIDLVFWDEIYKELPELPTDLRVVYDIRKHIVKEYGGTG